MNWKKISLYVGLLLLVSCIILAILADRNTIQIYGGLTTVVDPDQFQPRDEPMCITNVNVLSADGERFLANRTICIENGLIVSIDSGSQTSSALMVDGGGKFLIPGLVDSHVHLFKSENDLLLYIANGVTEIREMIGEPSHLQWRKEIQAGRFGPDMFIASPRLGSFGRIEGWFMEWTQGFNNVRNASEAEVMVKDYANKGYDAVKIYSYLNKASYDAINEVAVAQGLKVVGHVPWELYIEAVITSNQSELAHLEEVMNALRREFGKIDTREETDRFLQYIDARSKELAPMLRSHGVSVTTTLWLTQSFVRQKFELDQVLREVELAYENPGISEWDDMIPRGLGWLPEVNRYKLPAGLNAQETAEHKVFWAAYGEACRIILENFARVGVNIMAGTDTNLPPTVPGFSLHDELETMKKAGMSSAAILRSATTTPAKWMGSNTGQVAPGFKANLVLLTNNPLEDISHTRTISAVVMNGKLADRNLLDSILDRVKSANDESRKVNIEKWIEEK